ncbi:2-C-methyl-D-erythritol 4-phosphate cytidylyltransferase [Poriferisphaera corsica]|uniref:2-C-methyl-D-erythritol 4-phosphate cytidylyltransferase n=1 Tax=Poriferisphaera corsica TaxID=2528020 RepID=A0A517YVI5_9BACT|nr:2-C-methyl-D-erythritol 4-phosphate cytidylyltransferase [Poriferisphaera corsica]QDU34234.1 2-C-methyl-D-erythritol 4-phosphate cytidylyltransferase [Poriferisphaera corsica]
MKIAVIIPAAGIGKRFVEGGQEIAGGGSKVEMVLAGKPVFLRAIELFLHHHDVHQVILAVNPDQVGEFRMRYGDKLGFMGVKIVAGGKKERWETVMNALEAVDDVVTHVAVHDAARPLASGEMIERVFTACERHDAVIPGVAVNATLKKVADAGLEVGGADDVLADAILGSAGKVSVPVQRVVETVSREAMVEVQTPQVVAVGLMKKAYAQIRDGEMDGNGITDDASLVEAMGIDVYVVEGESTNFKITRREDAELAEALLEKRETKAAAGLAKKRLFGDEDED